MKNTNQMVSSCGSTARAQQCEHGQHATAIAHKVTVTLSGYLRGDGGCFNPPCRQQSDALKAVITRAPALCIQRMRISRPVDGFIRGLITNRSHGNRDRGLEQHRDESGLRFLIISEVPAVYGRFINYQNRPQGHALLGFKGFLAW